MHPDERENKANGHSFKPIRALFGSSVEELDSKTAVIKT